MSCVGIPILYQTVFNVMCLISSYSLYPAIFYAMWLMLVTLAYTYNAAAIPLRGTFLQAEYYHKQVFYEDSKTAD